MATGAAPVSGTPETTSGVTGGKSGPTGSPDVDSNTVITSLDDLRQKAPKVYNAMMQGIAMQICNQMEHAQQRLKQMMRAGEQQS
jgi:hypothetical protein